MGCYLFLERAECNEGPRIRSGVSFFHLGRLLVLYVSDNYWVILLNSLIISSIFLNSSVPALSVNS